MLRCGGTDNNNQTTLSPPQSVTNSVHQPQCQHARSSVLAYEARDGRPLVTAKAQSEFGRGIEIGDEHDSTRNDADGPQTLAEHLWYCILHNHLPMYKLFFAVNWTILSGDDDSFKVLGIPSGDGEMNKQRPCWLNSAHLGRPDQSPNPAELAMAHCLPPGVVPLCQRYALGGS